MKHLTKKLLTSILLIAGLTGCASVQSVSLTPIPKDRGRQVQAVGERMIFLAFNFDNNYVDSVTEGLKSQCQNGLVTGILTKDETILYLAFFLYKKRVTATGYCVGGA